MANEPQVLRGTTLRAAPSPELFDVLHDRYGIETHRGATDLGGSSNLNLLVTRGVERLVVRVYRPWVTAERLAAMQLVRRRLAQGGVPCVEPLRTRDGEDWVVVDGRLVEVEPYVAYAEKMDSWERLEAGLPTLGRIHSLLQPIRVGPAGAIAPASNNVDAAAALAWTRRGTECIRAWNASPAERRLADAADELARMIDASERDVRAILPRQLVHGDFWDNNVFFRAGRVVLVTDFDFMGERPRVDDLALTLYYTNSKFWPDPLSEVRIGQLRRLVDAYDRGLAERLTKEERSALPLALARAPLAFIGMIATVDTEPEARRLVSEMIWDVAWALANVRDLARWKRRFADR